MLDARFKALRHSLHINSEKLRLLIGVSVYALIWLVVSFISLHAGHGQFVDHIATAFGLGVFHAACAVLIAAQTRARWLILSLYGLASATVLFLLTLHLAYVESSAVLDADAIRAIAQTNYSEMFAYARRIVS